MLAAVALGGCGSASAPAVNEAPAPEETAIETPTPTPTPNPAAVQILVEDGKLNVSTRSIPRDQGAIELHLENAMDETVEVILARGKPGTSPRKIQDALVTGDAVQAGQPRLNRVRVEPGRHTLILRMPAVSGTDVLDSVALRVEG